MSNDQMLTCKDFGKRFALSNSGVASLIRQGKLRAVDVCAKTGEHRPIWRIPASEVARLVAIKYKPKKSLPVVCDPKPYKNGKPAAKPKRESKPTRVKGKGGTVEQQIEFHASELRRLIKHKVDELSALAELAEHL